MIIYCTLSEIMMEISKKQVDEFYKCLHYSSQLEKSFIIKEYEGHFTPETQDQHYSVLWDTLFQHELKKIFQAMEHATYHAMFQDLTECYERLVTMTKMRSNLFH